MWKAFISLFTRAIMLAEDLQRLREQVKEHSCQIDELADGQTSLRHEYQLQREQDARAREREFFELNRRLSEQRHQEDQRELASLRTELQMARSQLENQKRTGLPAAPIEKQPDES